MKEYSELFIGGQWEKPSGSGVIKVVSPSTEEVIGSVPEGTTEDIDRAVLAARDAFDNGPWPSMDPAERAEILKKVALGIQSDAQGFANEIANEVGSPVSWGMAAQVLAPVFIFNYYAGLAGTYNFEELRQGVLGQAVVMKDPVGVVGAIAPWNVPLFIAAAKIAPALLAGCTVVYKPAPETPLCNNRLAELFESAGLPEGVLSMIPAGREVGEHLVTHPGVDKISFTGSTIAGKKIGALCAERMKRFSLELGGKSAAIILDDVNIDEVIQALVLAGTMNNGQACVAQTRILVPNNRYKEITDALVDRVSSMVVGDPADSGTEVGPLIAERQRDRVEGYIAVGKEEGAKIATGGRRPEKLEQGWYVEPTVFVDTDNSMKIAREEIFGPVLAVMPYVEVGEAIEIANDSPYGLAGTVWSSDPQRALEVAKKVRTGSTTINNFLLDFAVPFGGYRESGMGREFGPEGLELFLETKAINLPHGFTPSMA